MKAKLFSILIVTGLVVFTSCFSESSDSNNNTSGPAAPGASVVTAANGELLLNWTAVDSATSYEVWISETNGSSAAALKADNITGTSYIITGLTNDKTYYIWIKAKYATGTSGFGTIAEAKPAYAWYNYMQNAWGFAKVQQSLSFNSSTFQEMTSYWDGNQWIPFFGLKGSVQIVSGNSFNFNLDSIYLSDSSVPGTFKWYN